jgi:hypothetical protein
MRGCGAAGGGQRRQQREVGPRQPVASIESVVEYERQGRVLQVPTHAGL